MQLAAGWGELDLIDFKKCSKVKQKIYAAFVFVFLRFLCVKKKQCILFYSLHKYIGVFFNFM